MPSDVERLEFSSQLLSQFAPAPREKEDEERLRLSDQLIREIEPAPEAKYAGQADEEMRAAQQQAGVTHARGVLESSPLPGLRALTTQIGADIVSPVSRVLGMGEYADRMNRFGDYIEQAARERDESGILPTWLSRGVRGAGRSMGTMIPAGMAAGPYGAITVAAGQETNRAITEGKDAGKKGTDLAGYAISQGIVEGMPAAVMQRVGLGGVESIFGKRSFSIGVKEGLKRLGITAAQELPEELFTEVTHAVVTKLHDVDPNALDAENVKQIIADTTVQTLITVGFMGAPGIARSIKAGKAKKIADEIEAMSREGKTPTRRDWRRWGLRLEMGETLKQRRAFSRALLEELEAAETPAAGQEAIPPEVTPEAPGDVLGAVEPEGIPIPPETPEATSEAPAAEIVPTEIAPPTLEPQPGDDLTVALNKKASNRILADLGQEALEDPGVRSFREVAAQVSNDKADEKALKRAEEITRERQGGSDYDHVAIVVKVGKLQDELDQARADQSEAARKGDVKAHADITARIEGRTIGKLTGNVQERGIVGEIALLAQADAYAGTESARAVSARQVTLSRENYDVVNVMQMLQNSKGPEGPAVTSEEENEGAVFSKEVTDLQAEVESLKEEARIKDKAIAKGEAQKVLDSIKKKGFGRVIKEQAAAEREDIKAQIRKLGYRVHDITGVSAEGAWLIGRLGVSYIKSGIGTLVELAEQLRSDMPDLNLTDYDVWQTLLASNPKLKAHQRTEAERKVASFKSMAKKLIEIEDITNGIAPERVTRISDVTPEMKKLNKLLSKARAEYYESEINAAKLEKAILTVNQLQDLIKTGRQRIKKLPGEVPQELAQIREKAQQLRTELRVNDELANVNRQLESGNFDMPVQRVKKPIDPKLERKQIELARKKRELRQWIADAAPWTPARYAKEVASLMKTMKATADISFTMRQNVWQVFSHPLRSTGAKKKIQIVGKVLRGEELALDDKFLPSLSAFFSENSADEIYNSMANGPNGFLYEKHQLAILDASSTENRERSEVFRTNVIERSKLPGLRQWGWIMKASARNAVTIGNLIRTSAFDQFLVNHPNATAAELTAFADYVNVSTGLGNMGRWGAVGDELQTVFFSPKFAVSRPQTPYALYKHWRQPRVRREIAKDMVKFASTTGMVLVLARLAGFDVEWRDPDDPDWLKIRWGNTRWDVIGGYLQPTRLIARTAKTPLRDEKDDFGPIEALGRFAAYKFAPWVTTLHEALTGKTAVGEERGLPETAVKALLPFILEDIHDAWKQEGVVTGTAAGIGVFLGIGVNTYQDSRTAAFRKIRNFQSRGDYSGAARYKSWWNQANKDEPPIRTVSPRKQGG